MTILNIALTDEGIDEFHMELSITILDRKYSKCMSQPVRYFDIREV